MSAFTPAVVERADDDGAVDVLPQEAHEHFLPDTREKLPAPTLAVYIRHSCPSFHGTQNPSHAKDLNFFKCGDQGIVSVRENSLDELCASP